MDIAPFKAGERLILETSGYIVVFEIVSIDPVTRKLSGTSERLGPMALDAGEDWNTFRQHPEGVRWMLHGVA